jgi:hypothetical protein
VESASRADARLALASLTGEWRGGLVQLPPHKAVQSACCDMDRDSSSVAVAVSANVPTGMTAGLIAGYSTGPISAPASSA